MHAPKPIIHSNTPRAARTLMTEIAKLREDINNQSNAILDLEAMVCLLMQELRQHNLARQPRYLPADSE